MTVPEQRRLAADQVGYLAWLRGLETPPVVGFGAGVSPDLTVRRLEVRFLPDGAGLPVLGALLEQLAVRLLPPASTPGRPTRVDIVVTAAVPGAARVLAGDQGAPNELLDQVRDLLTEWSGEADVVLLQTLPVPADADEAPLTATAAELQRLASDTARAQLVPVHRVASLDVLTAACDFERVAGALSALGRAARVGYLWNRVLDLAWAHWRVLATATGHSPKVTVTDLDEVVWPGTLVEGDTAPSGPAHPGEGTPGAGLGDLPHGVWRDHLRRRAGRGGLLAAVSRNATDDVTRALPELAPQVLFSQVHADPDIDKPRAIIKVLDNFDGIDPAQAVFVDDAPGQQERMRAAFPTLTVPAVVAPALLIDDLLAQIPAVGTGPVTDTDLHRGAYYAARATGDLIPEITVLVDPDDPAILARLAQLHERTNQFNFTTPRRTSDELARLTSDLWWSVLAFRVTYHGCDLPPEIIGCAEVQHQPGCAARLDSFLASCRLLWSGVNQRMLDQILTHVRARGIEQLTARWHPNGRNEGYARWFQDVGWATQVVADDDGLVFHGPTRTKAGQSPHDLLGVMGRYLERRQLDRQERETGLTAWTAGPVRKRPRDGAVELLVPGGTFLPGVDGKDIDVIRSVFGVAPIGEQDRPEVDIDPFWMDTDLVTRDMFERFLAELSPAEQEAARQAVSAAHQPMQELGGEPTNGDIPILVDHEWANRYAEWAGGRLPTEDEWEYAARGGDGRWFPWGAAMPKAGLCPPRGCGLLPISWQSEDPSDFIGAHPLGLRDMTGHVWQWCSTTYRGHPQYRGGDTNSNEYFLRTTVRPLEGAVHCGHMVGFRVVRDLDPDRPSGRRPGCQPQPVVRPE